LAAIFFLAPIAVSASVSAALELPPSGKYPARGVGIVGDRVAPPCREPAIAIFTIGIPVAIGPSNNRYNQNFCNCNAVVKSPLHVNLWTLGEQSEYQVNGPRCASADIEMCRRRIAADPYLPEACRTTNSGIDLNVRDFRSLS
jgi:hypothetical protein